MSKPIPYAIPIINRTEIRAVKKTLKSNWITTGKVTQQFEKNFSQYIGCQFSIAVSSATAGLHLALKAIGIQQGDYVITSVYTFSATAAAIEHAGGIPVFCDIDSNTKNIETNKLEELCKLYTKKHPGRLKAIIPVHFAGQSCQMDKILELARYYNLKIIEDAAHALPCTYHHQKIGTVGDITVFSFYATKPITTAEGGMITTNNFDLFSIIKNMRLHGINKEAWERENNKQKESMPWGYDIINCGFKYNLPDVLSAIGIEQLKKIDVLYSNRKKYAAFYNQSFSNIPEIQTPFLSNPQDVHSFHLYCISVPSTIRNAMISTLLSKYHIQCSVHFIPLCKMTYWKNQYQLKESDFANAIDAFHSTISLPIYSYMQKSTLKRVVYAVKKVLHGN